MAPIPPVLFPLAQSEWRKRIDSINASTNPRKVEHMSAEKTLIIAKKNEKPILKYKELKLDEKSTTYGEVVKWLSEWKTESGEKQALQDLISLKYTIDMSRATNNGSGCPLYIAMHGGGGPAWIREKNRLETLAESADSNDEQWWEMTQLYKGSIKSGVYVTTRGVGNSWDLHFREAGYVLMEKLIENMIMFQGIDSDQVYLLGFSAGGDGVYRYARRLSQRFAAVNMGGGNPGDVKFENLMNTPICLQIGEQDRSDFDRCKNVATSALQLDQLRAKYPNASVYMHDVFIHPTSDVPSGEDAYIWKHWSWENVNGNWQTPDKPRGMLVVIKDYTKWLNSYPNLASEENKYSTNTNAVDWLSNHLSRDTTPRNMIWDLRDGINDNFKAGVVQNTMGRGEDGKGRSQNFWLDINQYTSADVGTLIEAKLDKSSNTVVVLSAKKYLRILLRAEMLDLAKPVHVQIADQDTLSIQVNTENLAVIQDTMVRNDPNLIFTSDIILTQDDHGKWSATTTPASHSNIKARL